MENNNIPYSAGVTETSLLKRVAVFLEDGDFTRADEYCERVLDINVENGEAYLYKLLAKFRFSQKHQLYELAEPFENEPMYAKIMRFGSAGLKKELYDINRSIIEKKEEKARLAVYEGAVNKKNSLSLTELTAVCRAFCSLGDYKNSKLLLGECIQRGERLYDEG